MTYKTILVHVDAGKRCFARLDIAIRLAKRFSAHLVGLHALSVFRVPGYAITGTGQTIIDLQQHAATEHAKQGEAMFRRAVDKADLPNTEWRASFEDALAAVTLHARYADLVLIGQPDPDDGSGVEPDFGHRLVLAAGRPVLVVPYAGQFETVGKRVLLAWNAGREATRAATDALPFLQATDTVNLLAISPDRAQHGKVPGADFGLYLARHGVRVETSALQTEIDVGNQLLSRAADLSCDLIVMGAYGHSRVVELVLGGVTRTTFASMTVPVLMSH